MCLCVVVLLLIDLVPILDRLEETFATTLSEPTDTGHRLDWSAIIDWDNKTAIRVGA